MQTFYLHMTACHWQGVATHNYSVTYSPPQPVLYTTLTMEHTRQCTTQCVHTGHMGVGVATSRGGANCGAPSTKKHNLASVACLGNYPLQKPHLASVERLGRYPPTKTQLSLLQVPGKKPSLCKYPPKIQTQPQALSALAAAATMSTTS
jgi:hypothetical protein